jgi:twitching motility protein PilT
MTDGGPEAGAIHKPMMRVKDRSVSVRDLLRAMHVEQASDLFLQVGSPVRMKRAGKVATMPTPPLTHPMLRHVMSCFLTPDEIKTLGRRTTADMVYTEGTERYRVHFAFGHSGPYATIRIIGADVPQLDDLALPKIVVGRVKAVRSGLLIICGSTDAGKTVTCAAFIDYLNEHDELAILTLEDPIEFLHGMKNSMVVQKEIGLHAPSFAAGLRSALRENVDVIFVGEMRERETIEQVLRAGETGHLVVATLHSDDCLSAILRIVGTFGPDEQPRIRQSLAATLTGVVFQRLLPRRGEEGGRVPCIETLWANTAVKAIVRGGDLSKLASYTGRATGGVGYRDCLLDLRSFNEISEETVQQELRRLKAGE